MAMTSKEYQAFALTRPVQPGLVEALESQRRLLARLGLPVADMTFPELDELMFTVAVVYRCPRCPGYHDRDTGAIAADYQERINEIRSRRR